MSKVLKNGSPWQSELSERLKKYNHTLSLYIDRSFQQDPRYPAVIQQLTVFSEQQGLALQVIKTNGAVMNAIGVLENAPACYLKLPKAQLGGGSLWDFSATAAITQALSAQYLASSSPMFCEVSDSQGAPLALNRSDSNYMNHKGVLYTSGLRHHIFFMYQ
ncbi:hypothetical protein ACPSKX_13845 [Moritella viscosa]